MSNSRPRILVFSEARYELGPAGTLHSQSPALSGQRWTKDLPSSAVPVLVARARACAQPVGEAVVGETIVLPYYVGVARAVLHLLATWRAIDSSVAGADLALIKVPGIIGGLASLSASRRGVPIAAQVVGDAAGVLRSGAAGRIMRAFSPIIERITASTVRRAQTVRYVTRRQLQERYPPHPNAEVHAFSDVVIADEPVWAAESLTNPRLVAVGSLDQLYKGHHHLIVALAVVRQKYPTATLTIIGDGRQLEYLQRVANDNGVANGVDFRGYVGEVDELRAVLSASTLFVLPSLTEGMPRALIEAMALGLPSIASRVGGVPELLRPTETFEPADIAAMAELIIDLHRDPERLRQLSQDGVKTTRPYEASAREVASRNWRSAVLRLSQNDEGSQP